MQRFNIQDKSTHNTGVEVIVKYIPKRIHTKSDFEIVGSILSLLRNSGDKCMTGVINNAVELLLEFPQDSKEIYNFIKSLFHLHYNVRYSINSDPYSKVLVNAIKLINSKTKEMFI